MVIFYSYVSLPEGIFFGSGSGFNVIDGIPSCVNSGLQADLQRYNVWVKIGYLSPKKWY